MNWPKKIRTFENWCLQIGHDPLPPTPGVTELLWRAFMHYVEEKDLDEIPRMRSAGNVLYLVVDGAYGRYVPQAFAEKFAVPDDDHEILLEGPNGSDLYWEAWDDVLRYFKVEDEGFGTEVFFTAKDGDIFAVRDDISEVESYLYLQG